MTALALVPLSIWFVFSIISHIGDSHTEISVWIAQPSVALLLILYLGFMFFHAQLGVQVVIEDYIHSEPVKIVSLLLIKGIAIVAGLASILAVLRLAL